MPIIIIPPDIEPPPYPIVKPYLTDMNRFGIGLAPMIFPEYRFNHGGEMLESYTNNFPESVSPQNMTPVPPPLPRRRPSRSSFAESFFVKYGFKFILGFVVIVVFLTVVQCDIKKPEAPTWNTNLTIPMMSRTYTMPEIIDKIDQPGLGFDDDSNIVFTYSSDIDTFAIDTEEMRIDDVSLSFSEHLGLITLDLTSPDDQTFYLSDLIPVVGGIIPGTSFDIYYDLPIITEYDWAAVATGGFYVVIVNDLGVDLSLVQMDLIDKYYVRSIASPPVTFPDTIPSGGRDSVFIDVGGQTISCQIGVDLHCETPGGTVLTTEDKIMSSAVKTNTLTVSSAYARIPELTREVVSDAAIAYDNTITAGEMTSGTAVVRVVNDTQLDAELEISLPDFNLDGVPLTRHITVGDDQTQQVNIDLTGYTFEPLDLSHPQSIECNAYVIIDSTAPGKAVVANSDSIRVTVSVSNVAFSAVEGIFSSTEAQFESVDLDIDLPRGFDEIQLLNAQLVLQVENAFALDGNVSLTINGSNGQSLIIDTVIPAGSMTEPAVTVIIENDLADFLNPVPDAITVSGSADFSGTGRITPDDYLFATVYIESPMEMMIDSATFEGDLTSEEIEQDDIDLITDHVRLARIISSVENHLPLGAAVDIHLGGDSATILDNPQVVISLEVDAGTVDENGNVIAPTSSENIITLDSLEIKVLENPVLYTAQIISLQSTDGQSVKINLDDYIHVSGIVEVEYQFDGEF